MTDKIQVKEFLVDQEELEGPNRSCRALLREWEKRSSRRQLRRNCKEKKKSDEEKGREERGEPPPPPAESYSETSK